MNQPTLHTARETDLLMIVDDDPVVSQSLERLLRREGYDTISARDGKAALDLLQSEGVVPSVILLDLMMPRMSGLELLERLERDDTFCHVPIILMSGHAALTQGSKVRSLHLLPKPFQPEDLLRLVQTLGRQSSSRWIAPSVDSRWVAGQR